jgi:hypothetical protein
LDSGLGPVLRIRIFSRVNDSIMKTRRSTFPEFDVRWDDSPATPMWRSFYFFFLFKFTYELSFVLFKFYTAFDWSWLIRSPSTNLTSTWSTVKVIITFLGAYLMYSSFNPNLSFQWSPPKCSCSVSILRHLITLSTLIISEKNKSSVINCFHQNKSRTWFHVCATSTYTHGVCLVYIWTFCFFKPLCKECKRFSWYSSVVKTLSWILFSHLRNFFHF